MLNHSVLFDCLQFHGLQPARVLFHGDSPGENIGVDCLFLLQRISPTQGLNPCLLHSSWILYCLSHQGSPWVQCCCCCVTSVVTDSVRPHRRQPTRLLSPWDSRQEYWSGLPFPSPGYTSSWKL